MREIEKNGPEWEKYIKVGGYFPVFDENEYKMVEMASLYLLEHTT